MNLEDFPMDIQKCPLKFGSCTYENKKLKRILILFITFNTNINTRILRSSFQNSIPRHTIK